MRDLLVRCYRFIFARPQLYHLNLHLYKLSLRGLGLLNAEGPWTTGEDWFQQQLLRINSVQTILDVGANLDVYGANVFLKAKIIACEPHPQTFIRLQQIYKKVVKTQQLILLNVALSDTVGNLSLWDFANDAELKHTQLTSTLASLDKKVIEQLHGQKAQGFRVKVQTVDALVKKYALKNIDLLKIDTEGHELQVLQGAKKTLAAEQIKLIQFEFNEMNVLSHSFFRDFLELLPEYNFYRLLPHGLVSLQNYRPLTHELFGFQNIVCVHKTYADEFSFLPK